MLEKNQNNFKITYESLLNTPLQYIKGVGPRISEHLSRKNFKTAYDLIHEYPRTYKYQKLVSSVHELHAGQYGVIEGEVFSKKISRRFRNKSIYTVTMRTSNEDFFFLKYFKLPFRGFFDSIEIGQKIKVGGVVHFYQNSIEFHHPEFVLEDDLEKGLSPIYSEIEGVSQKQIRKILNEIFLKISQVEKETEDPLPLWIRKKWDLMTQISSLKDIHQPCDSLPELYLKFQARSQKSLIFIEFFTLQLHLLLKKLKLRRYDSIPLVSQESSLVKKLVHSLEFDLTSAQKRVFNEIKKDLEKSYPMHRLLQGDVGSGKTLVAFQTCLQAIESGGQAALMAPTEILAEQHYKKAQKWLSPLGVRVALLTSKTKGKKQILNDVLAGELDLCIGTHALIQDQVKFKNLAMIVIDEQHRFGVHQRKKLSEKASQPHLLTMTATPIPRTLAMTLYGDFDISIIDEMPKGRPPVITKKTNQREKVFNFLRKQVLQGQQAYVVYPLVEESENMDLKNAVEQFQKLKKNFSDIRWGLLHGKMKSEEKSLVIQQFISNKIQVLVTTTVIEVGVDIPGATLMVIEHSERFGLAALHQLRGRVGRGHQKSYCFLTYEKSISKQALDRLAVIEKISDGFQLAEKDLEFRGAGEFLGTKQSGLTHFKIAHFIRDRWILKQSFEAVKEFVEIDPTFKQRKHQILKDQLEEVSSIRL